MLVWNNLAYSWSSGTDSAEWHCWSGTERDIQSHWTFVLLFSVRTLSEKELEWSLLSMHAKSHFCCLESNLWCVWLVYGWLFGGWKLKMSACNQMHNIWFFIRLIFLMYKCKNTVICKLSYCVILVGIHGLFRMCFMEKIAQLNRLIVFGMQIAFRKTTHNKIGRFAVLWHKNNLNTHQCGVQISTWW